MPEFRVLPAGEPPAADLIAAMVVEMSRLQRDLGHHRVRLDTGARQPEAHRLYETAGYMPIDDPNDNPYAAFWGEKALR